MSKANPGGPAFPTSMTPGMSLRDYFAAHAPGIDPERLGFIDAEQQQAVLRACAENAYRWADALLEARAK